MLTEIRAACDHIESLAPMQSIRPDVVAEESLQALNEIIAAANQMRDAMLVVGHAHGLNIRQMSRLSGLSHVTVAKRLGAGI